MKKEEVLTIRWQEKNKRKFTQVCGNSNVSEAAREVLDAWLACHVSPAERRILGFRPEWQQTEPATLTMALDEFSKLNR